MASEIRGYLTGIIFLLSVLVGTEWVRGSPGIGTTAVDLILWSLVFGSILFVVGLTVVQVNTKLQGPEIEGR